MEMAQLWVNLPAKDKMSRPALPADRRGATFLSSSCRVAAGRVRVIAGEFGGVRGPAMTFTPINVWDVRLRAGQTR